MRVSSRWYWKYHSSRIKEKMDKLQKKSERLQMDNKVGGVKFLWMCEYCWTPTTRLVFVAFPVSTRYSAVSTKTILSRNMMCPREGTCLPVDCCLNELSIRLLVHYKTNIIISWSLKVKWQLINSCWKQLQTKAT
jgi:hypothetical protein